MERKHERSLILRPSHELSVRQTVQGRILDDMVATALTLVREAASTVVDLGALVREGKRIQSGEGITPENSQALKLFYQAATTGHSEAQYLVSECYRTGYGIQQDRAQALDWLRKSAESGFAEAQCLFAVRHYDNSGDVTFSYTEAAKWFRKAADQGHAGAQSGLAECYEYGMGIPQDSVQAVYWFQKAADGECETAQHNIGQFYLKGSHGLPRDLVQAYKWLKLAGDKMRCVKIVEGKSSPTSYEAAEAVGSQMTPTEIAAADALYREFRSNHPLKA